MGRHKNILNLLFYSNRHITPECEKCRAETVNKEIHPILILRGIRIDEYIFQVEKQDSQLIVRLLQLTFIFQDRFL